MAYFSFQDPQTVHGNVSITLVCQQYSRFLPINSTGNLFIFSFRDPQTVHGNVSICLKYALVCRQCSPCHPVNSAGNHFMWSFRDLPGFRGIFPNILAWHQCSLSQSFYTTLCVTLNFYLVTLELPLYITLSGCRLLRFPEFFPVWQFFLALVLVWGAIRPRTGQDDQVHIALYTNCHKFSLLATFLASLYTVLTKHFYFVILVHICCEPFHICTCSMQNTCILVCQLMYRISTAGWSGFNAKLVYLVIVIIINIYSCTVKCRVICMNCRTFVTMEICTASWRGLLAGFNAKLVDSVIVIIITTYSCIVKSGVICMHYWTFVTMDIYTVTWFMNTAIVTNCYHWVSHHLPGLRQPSHMSYFRPGVETVRLTHVYIMTLRLTFL